MTLEIQKYLQKYDSSNLEAGLAALDETYGIFFRRHKEYPNLYLFKYNQIKSPMGERIVQNCRGIIVDRDNDWSIVSMAYEKFFNSAEGHAATLDWFTAAVQEKLDGSLAVLYPYKGQWHVATSGTPDASGTVSGTTMTFKEYFWNTFLVYDEDMLPLVDCGYCFYFELRGLANRVVVVHPETHLALLGARNLITLQEISAKDAARIYFNDKIPHVKSFPLTNITEILQSFQHIDPLKQEGYVVCDGNFNRVKIKHPGYVALHHAKDGLNPKAFLEIARKGEVSEVLTAFPEFKPMLDEMTEKVSSYTTEIDLAYNAIKHIEVQKDFALEATKTKFSAALFALRQGKLKVTMGNEKLEMPLKSARDYVAHVRIDTLMEVFKVKEPTSEESND